MDAKNSISILRLGKNLHCGQLFQIDTSQILGMSSRLLLCAGYLATMAGCSSVHFYDGEKDKAAKAAQEAYQGGNVLTVVQTEREINLQALQNELELVSKGAVIRRNVALDRFFALDGDGNEPAVVDVFNERLFEARGDSETPFKPRAEQLGLSDLLSTESFLPENIGKTRIALNGIKNIPRLIKDRQEEYETAVSEFEDISGTSAPACEGNGALNSARRKEIETLSGQNLLQLGPDLIEGRLNKLAGACFRYAEIFPSTILQSKELEKLKEGEILASIRDRSKEETSLTRDRRTLVDLQTQLEAAKEAFNNATKKIKDASDDEEALQLLQQAAGGVNDIFDQMASLPGGLGIGAITEEKIAAIEPYLKVIGGEDIKADDPSTDKDQKGLAVLATITTLAPDVLSIIRTESAPLKYPLLIEKERLEIERDAARRIVERREIRITLLRDLLDALIQETRYLQRIREAITNNLSTFQLGATDAILGSTPVVKSAEVRRAIALYLDTLAIHRAKQEQIRVLLAGTEYDLALDHSETAVRQWDSLITPAMEQLKAYHAGGIKAEELAQILTQMIGFTAVAVGSNK